MNSIQTKSGSKPTLGSMLTEPASQIEKNVNPEQKFNFPKININLKKTHFTKYRSAFLSSEQTTNVSVSPLLLNQSKKKLNTQNAQEKQKDKELAEQKNKKKWKLNQKRGQKLNFFSIKTQSPHANHTLQPQSILNKKIHSPRQLNIQTSRFLITQAVRQYSLQKLSSPIQKIRLRSKEQINQNIKKSNRMISLIREKCKLQASNRSKSTKNHQSRPQNLGLFSYLHRQFVTNKTNQQRLNQQKIQQYFKHPSDPKIEEIINFKSRKFLKHKMFNDYKNSHEVKQFSTNLSKQSIAKEIQQKNKKYHSDYKKRISIPYFSFLSLPKSHQDNVLQNIAQKE